jgi:hypothetical protein
MDDSCPWPRDVQSPYQRIGGSQAPEVFDGQLYPDEKDRSTVWWRSEKGKGEWRPIYIEGVEKHPISIHRILALPDGRLFGAGFAYQGRFILDTKTGKTTQVGAQGGDSIYGITEFGGKVYWSGYPSAPIFVYDPHKPWTVRLPGPPDRPQPIEISAPESNPRRVHADQQIVFRKTRVKKMLSATPADDGKIYFGGRGQRDYSGGGLSWYDPKTGDIGGMWEPFENNAIGWVTTALDGRYVVIATEGGKTFVYDTKQAKIANSFEIVPGASKSGPLLEVAPGRMLGVTHDPKNPGAGIIYAVDVPSGKVAFLKPIPYTVPFNWEQGTDKYDFRLGPDGFVWTMLGVDKDVVLVRIDPRDATVNVVGKIGTGGHAAFVGNDLYLAGTEQMRVAKQIVPVQP